MSLRFLNASVAGFGLALRPVVQAQQVLKHVPQMSPAPAPWGKAVKKAITHVSEGKVSYYGAEFAGRKTSSGERVALNTITMAHMTLPFGTMVQYPT